MTVRLPPLTEEEFGLLLQLLRTEFHGPPTESGRKAGLRAAPIGPICRLAGAFEKYAKKNRKTYVLGKSVSWMPNPAAIHVAEGFDKQEAFERQARHQWRSLRDELLRVLEESHTIKWWGFRLPVMLPSRRAFIFRPADLILDWLAARMIANNQQFRFVPHCRNCGKPGLRVRGRKQNVYCSEECKNQDIVKRRRKERTQRRAQGEGKEEVTPETFRVVEPPSEGL